MTSKERRSLLKISRNLMLLNKYLNIHPKEDVSSIKIKVQKDLWLYLGSFLKIFSFKLIFASQLRPPIFS
jgi:hypothetical protein